eukprot:CAMPEP_0170059712 /NCGR_PEP_ID=MMETSP0019_2-20121128/1902_1 /TAXON_ID=98059 /ORGANISM="Dinobryon sp., Strain UTEXLB2267" /LENGTH=152 /DNA_ID=CAMNT_0010265061 /DNA_START=50 /DNA_END=508 /DNA_ORIENTATION=+
MKAELENINKLIPIENNLWKFNIKSQDGMDSREGITVSKGDSLELSGSKGEANFIIKWNSSNPQSYIKIVDSKGVSGMYTADNAGKYVTILVLECRGIEPTSCIPGEDFSAETSGGTVFSNIDLSDGDWAEYDEENDASVSITDVVYIIEKM